MWSESVAQNMRGIKEKNGIITKCLKSEGEVTLPDNFEGVAKNAFDGCEDVLINYPAKYIQKELEEVIDYLIHSYRRPQGLRVYDMTSEQIEDAIRNAVAKDKESNKWKVVVIDADDIADQKLETGDSYGVLFIKNLNVDNVDKLDGTKLYDQDGNFIYMDLSPNWLVVLEVGDFQLQKKHLIGSHFSLKGRYTFLTPERFMEFMRQDGKIVEPVEETNLDTDKEATNTKEQPSVKEATTETPSYQIKEIDWEERHFQICLALISRAELHSFHSGTVSSADIYPVKIINKADRMVAALKKHLEEGKNKD